jgi:hypothetical protein
LSHRHDLVHSDSLPAHKYGALNMTVSVGSFILRHPDLKDNMETFMMQFVLPHFTSSEPYMRAVVSLLVNRPKCFFVERPALP